MIKYISNLSELYKEINNDRSTKNLNDLRFPIRFIFLNTYDELREIAEYFKNNGVKIIELFNYLPHEDGWLSNFGVENLIKGINDISILVSFSELLRFSTEENLCSLLLNLSEFENTRNQERRIYLPIVGLWERIQKEFLENFSRIDNWASIWKLKTEESLIDDEKIIIYLLNEDTSITGKFDLIKNTSDLFNIWKNKNIKTALTSSDTISHLCRNFLPDKIFDCIEIKNPKLLIEKLSNIIINISYNQSDKEHWMKLAKDIFNEKKSITFKEIIEINFNIKEFYDLSSGELLQKSILESDEYRIWLIKCWISNSDELSKIYLGLIFENLYDYNKNNILNNIWFLIFKIEKPKESFFQERKKYLEVVHKDLNISSANFEDEINDKITEVFSDDLELKTKLKYLTDTSFAEKNFLIELLIKNSNKDRIKILELLKEKYINLYYYLAEYNDYKDSWIKDYFNEYRWSKFLNIKTEKLELEINKLNNNKETFYNWYYKLKSISEEDIKIGSKDTLLMIDGFGVEWFNLITRLIHYYGNRDNFYLEKAFISKAILPSVTECNKIFPGSQIIQDLDKYVHNQNPYIYPKDLIKEIDLIERIFYEEIIYKKWNNLIIVSDHGFTVFSQKKFGCKRQYDFKDSNHEGRCMWIEKPIPDDKDFFMHEVDHGPCKEKKVLIALKHNVLYKIPSRETHGGATPEEVLIPIIKISREKLKEEFDIILKTPVITFREPKVIFEIKPEPLIAPIIILKNTEYQLKKINQYWECRLDQKEVGEHNILLKIMNTEKRIKIIIKGGFKDRGLI